MRRPTAGRHCRAPRWAFAPRARARPGPGPIARAASVPRKVESNQNRAMIIVGGVALVVGAIIGDTPGTIIMVGGAGVGLYGLYKYLE